MNLWEFGSDLIPAFQASGWGLTGLVSGSDETVSGVCGTKCLRLSPENMTSKFAFFHPCLQQPCSGGLVVEVSRSASSRYRCLMEGSLSERWVISTHFGLFLAAPAALYLTLVSGSDRRLTRSLRIGTQCLTFETWGPSDIWSKWFINKEEKKTKERV